MDGVAVLGVSAETLRRLLEDARTAGADFCEIFLEKRRVYSLRMENGRIKSIEPVFARGAGLRFQRGKAFSYVSTNDVSEQGLQAALASGLDILQLPTDLRHRKRYGLALEPLRDYALIGSKASWENLSTEPLMQTVHRGARALENTIQHGQMLTVTALRDWQEVVVVSTDGVFARDVRFNQKFSLAAICEEGAHRISMHKGTGSTADPTYFESVDVESIANELSHSCGTMLRAEYVSARECPVVIAGKFGGVIFHEACGHLLETTSIKRGTTPFAGKRGEAIAHPSLTAWDEGLWDRAYGSLSMDDEGMPVQRTLLIENGVLKNFIADRAGAQEFGLPRTGSGRRQNHSFASASRMRNTFIDAGPHTPEEILATIEDGLYCTNMGGGSVGQTGAFNFSVNEAYEVKMGKIGKPVKGATLVGEAEDIMMKISMCGNDLGLAPGHCGSISGTVYTTVGQPTIKVDAIRVGGR
jgi:TldD protein